MNNTNSFWCPTPARPKLSQRVSFESMFYFTKATLPEWGTNALEKQPRWQCDKICFKSEISSHCQLSVPNINLPKNRGVFMLCTAWWTTFRKMFPIHTRKSCGTARSAGRVYIVPLPSHNQTIQTKTNNSLKFNFFGEYTPWHRFAHKTTKGLLLVVGNPCNS